MLALVLQGKYLDKGGCKAALFFWCSKPECCGQPPFSSESERLVRGNAMLDVVAMPGACDQLLIQAGAAEPKSK
jgi:hypothetical protein